MAVMWLLGLANLARAGGALFYASRLPRLPMTISWAYLAAMGGVWGIVFCACAVGMARFRSWGRWGALAAVTLYEVHVWINHLLFDASDYMILVRERNALLSLLLLAVVWGLLNLPGVRRVFG